MLIYNDFIKKNLFKKLILLFWRFLSYLIWVPSFKSINSSFLSRKKYGGVNLTPIPRQQLGGQNTSMETWLTELTESSDISNYKPILNIAFYKGFTTHFYRLYLCRAKSFLLKTELYFYFFWFGFRWHLVLQY